MFCTNCGSQVKDGSKFCMSCGAPMSAPQAQQAPTQPTAAQPAIEPAAAPQPTPQQQVYQTQAQPAVAPTGESPKTKTTAALFGFFLGGYGIMDFYAGNTKRGIIKLILTLTGIGAIATVIMNILDLFKVANGKYLDELGRPLSGPGNVAKILAIVAAVFQSIAIIGALVIIFAIAIPMFFSGVSSSSSSYSYNDSPSYTNSYNSDYSFTDSRDGQSYKTIRVGSMVWMAENLNYNNGNSYCYDNNSYNCNKYGRLYNWYSALSACPSGWRLPSKYDWEAFDRHIKQMGYTDKIEKAEMLRATEWYGTDRIGFGAMASGTRFQGQYYGAPGTTTESAHFWSSTEKDYEKAYDWFVYLSKSGAGLYAHNDKQERGYSVRCVRD